MSIPQPIRLKQLKTRAALLLKELKQASFGSQQHAARRFLCLPAYSGKTAAQIISMEVRLKDAYQVLALEHGFPAWTGLKAAVVASDCLYRPAAVAFIHAWFPDYQKAKTYLDRNGGYLLVFWKDYVVCGREYIEKLGLAGLEKEWARIGYNWAEPADPAAFRVLQEAAARNYLAQQ